MKSRLPKGRIFKATISPTPHSTLNPILNRSRQPKMIATMQTAGLRTLILAPQQQLYRRLGSRKGKQPRV